MTAQRRYTSAVLERLPYVEGLRYEIINGELHVTRPWSWWHQSAASGICYALSDWSNRTGLGESVVAPGVIFGPDDEAIPDTMWISHERFNEALDENGHLTVAPELMVEVLSPEDEDDHRRVYELKLRQYARYAVEECWIADWQEHRVDVFRRAERGLELAATLRDGDALSSPLLPGFAEDVASLWRD